MNKRAAFRRMLSVDGIVVAPGAYDALGARIIEKLGFDAIYLTGYGTSASLLGMPDVGLLTLNEMVAQTKYIDNAVDLPVVADAESGFGNAVNVARAVREYEKAGAAAIHIEDQVLPKELTNHSGIQVTSPEEHVKKIQAATKARRDNDFVIIARTDARDKHGIDEAVRRANAYVGAGADMIFVHGPQTMEELRVISKEIQAPQVVNYSTIIEAGYESIPAISQLEDMGFKLLVFPSILLFSSTRAMRDVLLKFRKQGRLCGRPREFIDIDEFEDMIGSHEVRRK